MGLVPSLLGEGGYAEARQRSHRHPYLPRRAIQGRLGTDGSCSTYQHEEVRLRDDRLLHGADADHIHTPRNVVKRNFSLSHIIFVMRDKDERAQKLGVYNTALGKLRFMGFDQRFDHLQGLAQIRGKGLPSSH